MTLLVADDAWSGRRAAAAGPLAPLADALAAELAPLVGRELYFPADKALLSREGGRCPRHGALLDFDPFAPHAHRCPACGEVYRGELHDRFWIYWYQLWLAERAVHAAVLARLGRGNEFARLARAIHDGYVERYTGYPNRDNVLGPTRLFFSTYLESIWLLQVCIATDLLRDDAALAGRVCDRIVEPSRAIIREYDEGSSNRQVWNDAALLAAGRLLGDDRAAELAVHGPSGIASHLAGGLLGDGTWFEGENYHLFAHRGLWYGVTMAERAGLELAAPLLETFQAGFAAPFATMLPDFTLPSRRDSQYAISLRQWRIAEHCELGLARAADDGDPLLLGPLARLYGDDVPRRPTGRATSSADVERNAQPTALTRADLSWRALLCARATLPPLEACAPRSALLEGQGIAVFRRDAGRAFLALDYGHSGGGHGHPDRLNLLLAVGETRWLDDFGTGSYVDPSLHWYRSTLAHNAPLFDGRSQRLTDGTLVAHDERGDAGWVEAVARDVAPGITVRRTLVVMERYAVDVLEWDADRPVTVDLPLHCDLAIASGAATSLAPADLPGSSGLEDGFAAVHDTSRQTVEADSLVHARARRGGDVLDLWISSSCATDWHRAVALGAPGRGEHAFRVLRAAAGSGRHQLVWSWGGAVSNVEFDDTIRVALDDGRVEAHRPVAGGWEIARPDRDPSRGPAVVRLGGRVEPELTRPEQGATSDATAVRRSILLRRGREFTVQLDQEHYRRSEDSWRDAGGPQAVVGLAWRQGALVVRVRVSSSDLTFASAGAVNLYDNEPADINGDSVQLYLRREDGLFGLFLVPIVDSSEVRLRAVDGWEFPHDASATWTRVGRGYELRIIIPCTAAPAAIDVVVNEMPRGRTRRRGQLVLSGAEGEWVYLRGDRHEAERLIALKTVDA